MRWHGPTVFLFDLGRAVIDVDFDAPTDYDHSASTLRMDADHAHIEAGWNSIYVGEIAETVAMLRDLRSKAPCCDLTNTNVVHARVWSNLFPAVANSFDRIFASHEMGMRKPERGVFDHVSREIGVAAQSIVFFDDHLENILSAAAASLQAVHVRTPADVRCALGIYGYAP